MIIVVVGKQQVLHSLSACLCSLRDPALNAHAPYNIFMCGLLRLYHIFPHYVMNGMTFGKKGVIGQKKIYVLLNVHPGTTRGK